jgi:hypothetical protein
MKKIIWIYGKQGSGKTVALRQFEVTFHPTKILIFPITTLFRFKKEFAENTTILIDEVDPMYIKPSLFKALIESSEQGNQIIISSQFKPPIELKDHLIILNAINPSQDMNPEKSIFSL